MGQRPEHEALISFARASDGSLCAIEEAERGLACQCTCLACNANLVARKGNLRRWSFAHQANQQAACEFAAETALHYAMKELIAQEKRVFVPQLDVSVSRDTSYGEKVNHSYSVPGKMVELDSVELEYSVNPIRPDIVAISAGRRLFIEVIVTHGVDDKKLAHIERIGASAFKIDLRSQTRAVDREMLRRIALTPSVEKSWIYHRRKPEYEVRLLKEVERLIAEKEMAYADRIANHFSRKGEASSGFIEKLVKQLDGELDVPLSDGSVMCFRLKNGSDAFLKRSPSGSLTLEFTNAQVVDIDALRMLNASPTSESSLWNLPEEGLLYAIPYLNSLSVSTTNRTKGDYMRFRYGL